MVMPKIKHYQCDKCGSKWIDSSDIEEQWILTMAGGMAKVKVHKNCGGQVDLSTLFKRHS